jgi:hypothetical protein
LRTTSACYIAAFIYLLFFKFSFMHCVPYTSHYYSFSYVLGEAGKLTARMYTRKSALAHASPWKRQNTIFFFFQICRVVIYINGVFVSDTKYVYVYVPSIFKKLLTEHGFANTANVRRHLHMVLLVVKFFLIAAFVVRMRLYFFSFSMFPFTYLWWRKESSFIVEADMIYCTIYNVT